MKRNQSPSRYVGIGKSGHSHHPRDPTLPVQRHVPNGSVQTWSRCCWGWHQLSHGLPRLSSFWPKDAGKKRLEVRPAKHLGSRNTEINLQPTYELVSSSSSTDYPEVMAGSWRSKRKTPRNAPAHLVSNPSHESGVHIHSTQPFNDQY